MTKRSSPRLGARGALRARPLLAGIPEGSAVFSKSRLRRYSVSWSLAPGWLRGVFLAAGRVPAFFFTGVFIGGADFFTDAEDFTGARFPALAGDAVRAVLLVVLRAVFRAGVLAAVFFRALMQPRRSK